MCVCESAEEKSGRNEGEEGGMRRQERSNEGGKQIRVRKRDRGVQRWGETDLLAAEGRERWR